MHTVFLSETTFHFNLDLSGYVMVENKLGKTTINGKDLWEFLMQRLRDRKVERIESMELEEFEKYILDT